jgi:uncharacterized repeat protein (TIGR04002 family)
MITSAKRIRTITVTAVFAALVFLATAYLPRLPFPGGYVHVGDAFIYLAACMLPTPWACAAGAIGAGLADALTGYILWAPGTILIKAAMALMFTAKSDRILSPRSILAVIPAGVICVGGYYLYEVLLTGSFAGPAASLGFNALQAIASAVIFLVLGALMDCAGMKTRILK